MNNLIVLDGDKTPNEMKESVEALKNMMPEIKEHLLLIAELTRTKYVALINEGFTEKEALELSKNLLGN